MLVNSINENKNIEYHYCSITRQIEDLYGKEGKKHIKSSLK